MDKPLQKTKGRIHWQSDSVGCVYFWATPEIASAMKEYGIVQDARTEPDSDYYCLSVNGLYDFGEVVDYLQNLIDEG